ncbi:MAG: hypothetical protein AAB388_00800 [Patescibacteria group bacterium]
MGRMTGRDMVRAMGAGMALLDLLEKEITSQSGDSIILAWLTKSRFRKNLKKIVSTMIECDWRIRASEMRRLAEKSARLNFANSSQADLEYFRHFYWVPVLIDLGIPFKRFDGPAGDEGDPRLPKMLEAQLRETTATHPIRLTYRGKTYVVVNFDYNYRSTGYLQAGELIDVSEIVHISLAEASYFDFDN